MPLSVLAFTLLPVTCMASGFGLVLLVRIRRADGSVYVRRLVTATADPEHQEHDRCCDCYEEDGAEAHRSRLSSDAGSS
jgi:hypothetical protein